MDTPLPTDILVVGGGPAGLACAAALGTLGLSVAVADPRPVVAAADDPDADLRSTAMLQPARDLLEAVGAWDRMDAEATPLEVMRMVDATRDPPVARDFRADDISDRPFGWNLPAWAIRKALSERVAELENVTLRASGLAALLPRSAYARATLEDGTRLDARLVVGADGRESKVRDLLGLRARTVGYGQTALVFAVTHERPHDNVSTEVHRSGGPFTLVPLPDRDGRPCSAVVWMDDADAQARRMELDPGAFSAKATERSADAQGALTLVGRRAAWPISTVVATRMTGPRTALMAEAAHAMPPIGAQGLNTSLRDAAALRDLCERRPDEIGTPGWLDAYARARHPDAVMRAAGIDGLNRVSQSGGLAGLRATGIELLHDVAPLRRLAMRMGLGA
ncbi:FAD-dependent monooxygenase [Jannaschia sp. Os4]|uniref:FAD-dependent monooxygenase n=1 Tax=Jannaschia sp. Os4 TaxID=2807617 RepID=UPI001939D281|nr:FAD-dependent monooxygenase [Jannaschia sp. Os4]MBM2576906.1 FAD-dependent monooxygenase [Jannaschia sp. Os4]